MKVIRPAKSNRRLGIGRVEVIVGLGLAVLVLTVIAGSIQSARVGARKLCCMCNLKNVGLGVLNFASGNGQNLLLLTSQEYIENDAGEGTLSQAWAMSLLPMLDSTSVLREIKRNAVLQADQRTGASMSTSDVGKERMPFFTCQMTSIECEGEDPSPWRSFRNAGRRDKVCSLFWGDLVS